MIVSELVVLAAPQRGWYFVFIRGFFFEELDAMRLVSIGVAKNRFGDAPFVSKSCWYSRHANAPEFSNINCSYHASRCHENRIA